MTHPMMTSSLLRRTRSAALIAAMAMAMALACSASFAGKPDGAGGEGHGNGHGNGNGGKHEQKSAHGHGGDDKHNKHDSQGKKSKHGQQAADVRVGGYFGDQQRSVIHTYYGEQFRRGHCPPGLAKKHNGCMPPGHAKRYVVGQRLPRDVVYYTVPQVVYVQLGTPPSGYKYVRVASDILLLAVGTGMVIDAIQGLGGL